MADDARNKEDAASFNELNRLLQGTSKELKARLDQSLELQKQSEAVAARTERVQAEASRPSTTAKSGSGSAGPQSASQQASAEERIAKAKERQATASKEVTAQQETQYRQLSLLDEKQQRPLGVGQQGTLFGGGRYGPPGSRPTAQAGAGGEEPPQRPISLREVLGNSQVADAGALRAVSVEQQKMLDTARAAAEGETLLGSRLQFSTRELGLSSDALRRHGALTSEFISAAAKGQVTIQELGNQVGTTIGKFAGWTLAASAVFGAADAIHELGSGALESLNGVTQLQRVVNNLNTQDAQQQFRDLARQFNLPIKDVADAAYGMGKVFRDQNEIFEATKTALFAVKVGELSAEQATQSLTAIVNGFKLNASDLPDVIDAVNNAQNRFGGNTGQLVTAVAKAAGAFKLAGGNYRDLTALIVTATRLGAQPVNAATAIARSASVLQTQAGAARAKAVGIDPSQDYSKILDQAFALAKGQSKQRVDEIARALVPSGGQFTRIFDPLLENQDLYNKVQDKGTSADAARGSALRELGVAVTSVSERFHRLSGDLQRIGSALGQAGAVDALGAMLLLLDQILNGAEKLVEVFDQIPRPFRDALAVALELAAATAVLRRVNAGSFIGQATGGRAPGLSAYLTRNPRNEQAAQITRGLGDQRGAFEDERRALAQQQVRNELELSAQNRRHATLLGTPVSSEEDQARLAASAARTNALLERRADIESQLAVSTQRIAATEQQLNEFRAGTRGGLGPQEAARRAGIQYSPGTLTQPSATRPVPIGGTSPGGVILPGGGISEEAVRQEVQAESDFAARMAESRVGLAKMGVSGRGVQSALAAGQASLGLAGRALGGVATGIKGFGTALAASIGPLDAVIIAAGIAFETYSYISNELRQTEQKIAQASQPTADVAALRDRARQLREEGPLQKLQDTFSEIYNLGAGGRLFGKITSPSEQRQQAAADLEETARTISSSQGKGVALTTVQIRTRLADSLRGAKSTAEKLAAYAQADKELAVDYGAIYGGADAQRASEQVKSDLLAQKAQLLAASGNFADALKAVTDSKSLTTFVTGLGAQVGLQGLTGTNVSTAAATVAKAKQLAEAAEPGSDEQAKDLAQLQQAGDLVVSAAQTRLNNLINLARSPAEAARYRRLYVQDVSKALSGGTPEQQAQLEQIKRQTQRDQFEQEQALSQSKLQVQVAGTQDPVKQARIQIKANNENLKKLAKEYGTQTTQYQQALAQGLQQQQALVSAQIDLFQSNQEVSTAQFDVGANQGQTLQRALSDAQRFRDFVQRRRKDVSPQTVNNAVKAVFDAQKALNDFVQEQAQALISAQGEYDQSLTNDPVKQATIELDTAKKLFAAEKGSSSTTPAQLLQQAAAVNNARRSRETAISQARLDTINFEASIGKISAETEIAQLERLLKTIHHNRDLQRQIEQQIYQLKHQADQASDLNVGNVRIPTLYEIRRAVLGGVNSNRAVQITNAPQIALHVRPGDAQAVGAVLDSTLGTSTRTALRKAGYKTG